MSRTRTSTTLFATLALCACSPAPDAGTAMDAGPAATPAEEPGEGEIRLRARVAFDHPAALPAGNTITVYVVKSDFESGTRELMMQRSEPVPAESPAIIDVDIAREMLDPAMGYEMTATMFDENRRIIMSTAANRPPTPAMALSGRNTFDLRLLAVAAPAKPEEIFQLPGRLALTCGAIDVDVRQEPGGDVLVSLPDEEVRLRPAAATSGGRFAGRGLELWFNQSGESLLMLPGQQPQPCASR